MSFALVNTISFLVSFSAGVFVTFLLARRGCFFPLALVRAGRGRVYTHNSCRNEALKMVLVVRKDLKMGTGKIAAQCAHAAVGVLEEVQNRRIALGAARRENLPSSRGAELGCGGNGCVVECQDEWVAWCDAWTLAGSKKVALQCDSEQELVEAYRAARREGLPHMIVRDAGRTQIAPGSKTVLAVGPAPGSLVDRVTGRFKLL
ncbi:hypothetical protein TRVL_03283 [Trypanosoma vivax]|uniref:peptidyl-tRNA hydrolase n=1 Tax=Trypanosoma vivax (strain Y486) TaxID=1055687 RepID=G0TZ30_TRYVY|nr:hypothetical protein TRVL_03283 [Trypanosoma vivax]CCC49233.1 conserved hypothetical protein [Trypanosoma vivax Y486]